MIALDPWERHASTEPADQCAAHDARELVPGSGRELIRHSGYPRAWTVEVPVRVTRMDGDRRLVALSDPVAIAAGTRLRLDAIRSSFFCDGQTHTNTVLRFCVLTGPLHGRCVQARDTLLDDHVTHSVDAELIATEAGILLGQLADWMAARRAAGGIEQRHHRYRTRTAETRTAVTSGAPLDASRHQHRACSASRS